MAIETMTDKEEYVNPMTESDLNRGAMLAQAAALRAKLTGGSDKQVELLIRYKQECRSLLQQEAMASQMPMAPGATPGAEVPGTPGQDMGLPSPGNALPPPGPTPDAAAPGLPI